MNHPNAQVLQKIYGLFAEGQLEPMLGLCADSIKFHVPGKTSLAGTYDKSNVIPKFFAGLAERSGGTLKVEIHDILANDRHATSLLTCKLKRNGKDQEYRAVHVWRFENGKPVAWYDYPRDLYHFDGIWG